MSRRGRSRGRDLDGVLLLDKPVDLTSNEVLQRVKRLLNARKAGHTGSLDRVASGMLPLCFGEATKFSSFLLDADKHYVATCRLGRGSVPSLRYHARYPGQVASYSACQRGPGTGSRIP